MKINICKDCRRSMRLWALDWRRETGERKRVCLAVALDFRSGECWHTTSTYSPHGSSGPTTSDFARHLANNLSPGYIRDLADSRRSENPVGVRLSSTPRRIGASTAQIESGLQAEARLALECIRQARRQFGRQIPLPIPGEFGERSARMAAVRAMRSRGEGTAENPGNHSCPKS